VNSDSIVSVSAVVFVCWKLWEISAWTRDVDVLADDRVRAKGFAAGFVIPPLSLPISLLALVDERRDRLRFSDGAAFLSVVEADFSFFFR